VTVPWIEVDQYQDHEGFAGPGSTEYAWQALFACQVGVRSHQEWFKLKWGFNASALFDETLERQRLFLESQYAIRNELGIENPDQRTLAFRYINRPGEGLLLAILGKIRAPTEAKAIEYAVAFYYELRSTFPYDYSLVPALSEDEFTHISGWDILESNGQHFDLAQIKRYEAPIRPNRSSPVLQGFWQSGERTHEQIWRALAASHWPLLLNLSVRGTLLYEKERERLLTCADEIARSTPDGFLNARTLAGFKQWNETYIERRLKPWQKYFYLQVHLASPQKIDENLFRIVGTSLTLDIKNHQHPPGFQVMTPEGNEAITLWRKKLRNLDFVFSGSYLPVPRLAEVVDMEEVFAVMRLPYAPPDNGFPDMNFAAPRVE
jgi:hypothetical protein